MKSDLSNLQKLNPIKKPTKPLNQKKNSMVVEPTLKKQKSKINLTLNDNLQLSSSNAQKLASPKNTHFPSSILSPKTQGNEEFFKQQKSQLRKTGMTNAKIKKLGVTKHEPIRKDFLPTMKSPKNTKATTVQSEMYINTERYEPTNFNEQSNLTIDLETSILKPDHEMDSILQDHFVLNQSSIHNISQIQQSKIQELSKTSKEQCEEILRLKERNEELERKLTKLKQSQEENRKKLKERISSFNEEGEEIKVLKERVVELEKQVATLQSENQRLIQSKDRGRTQVQLQTNQYDQSLKAQILQASKRIPSLQNFLNIFSLKILPTLQPTFPKHPMIDQSVMTSFQDSICDNVLSFINGSGSVNNLEESLLSNEKIKDSQSESYNVIPALEIEVIKNSYEEKYKERLMAIEGLYKESIKDIENRVEVLLGEAREMVKSQQSEIMALQNKIDQLYQQLEEGHTSTHFSQQPTLQTDEQNLRHMMQINSYKQKLSQKDEQLKTYRQDAHTKEIECKRLLSELDIERIKWNLSSQINNVNKQMVELAQKQKFEILVEELKQEKERCERWKIKSEKKEELIRKLTKGQQQGVGGGQNAGNKKIRK